MILIADRFETVERTGEKLVICEDEERKMFAIPFAEAPEGIRAGDVLVIDAEGNLTKDEQKTKERREAIAARRRKTGK